MRVTPARYRALQWFADHEDDQASVKLLGDRPTKKMRNLMEFAGQLRSIEVGQFGYRRFVLTETGRHLLAKSRRMRLGKRNAKATRSTASSRAAAT